LGGAEGERSFWAGPGSEATSMGAIMGLCDHGRGMGAAKTKVCEREPAWQGERLR
jgi:hypothetical protein